MLLTKGISLIGLFALLFALLIFSSAGRFSFRTIRNMAQSISNSSETPYSMAFVTVPNKEVGEKLASELVDKQLAACVNMIPGLTSIYKWEGKIEKDSELLLMIKTKTELIDEISEYVRKNHPYDVAEVISSKIDNGNPPYLKWIGESVK